MSSKAIFIAILAIHSALALESHTIVKRQAFNVSESLVSATQHWSQYLTNTLRNWTQDLRNRTNADEKLNQIHSNITQLRSHLSNATSDGAEVLMSRLWNMTQRLNSVMRERVNNDQNLVVSLYGMIVNATQNGTNHSTTAIRDAFTSVTQRMANNYNLLANHSQRLAHDMSDKGSQLFNNARIRAGNDTNKAVMATTTALNAIRNSSTPINETVQRIAANLTEGVRKLSVGLRNLMNQTPTENGIELVQITANDFKQKAEQSLQKLMSSINQLKNSLQQFSSNARDHNNSEDNAINIIENASNALVTESAALQQQINALHNQN